LLAKALLDLLQDMLLQVNQIVCSCLDGSLVCSSEASFKVSAGDVYRQLLAWVKQKLDKLDMLLVLIDFEAPLGDFSDYLTHEERTLITTSASFT
jgi:hypothetical protein